MKHVQLIINSNEQENLLKLLDLAVKAGGLGVAFVAHSLAVKVKEAPERYDSDPTKV